MTIHFQLARLEFDAVLDHIHGAWQSQNPLMLRDAMHHLEVVEVARQKYPLNPHQELGK